MAVIKPTKYELNILNFSLGIRAKEINENFDLIRYWIETERLRTAGWGLVEGFELSRDLSDPTRLTIHVDSGILINRKGQEIHVPEKTFPSNPISRREVCDIVTSDEDGVLKLTYPVYADTWHRVVLYSPEINIPAEEENGLAEELKIVAVESGLPLVLQRDVIYVAENEIRLTPRWANTQFRVNYKYAADRIDAIFVAEDGTEYLEPLTQGIISTSPSRQDIQEYLDNGWYLIGLAYWHIGQEIDVEFFTENRMYRRVYVDKNNILYLNGKPYQEKTVIYFTEPNPPQENDLWYCLEDEILYIWRPDKNGVYDWQPVNDLGRSITEVYQFPEEENPSDLRTFDFHNHPNLFFMPGMHQVTVIIDQVVLMEDQYEELYFEEDTNNSRNRRQHLNGYGIRLRYPLERPSVVEIRIKHDISTKKHDTDLFQHPDSLFIATNTIIVDNIEILTYNTQCEYESGKAQLELFRNGIRLMPEIQYQEIQKDGTASTMAGQLCNRFKLLFTPAIDDALYFRVMRPVTSYENLKAIMQDYEDEIEACNQLVNQTVAAFELTAEDLRQRMGDVETQVENTVVDVQDLKTTALTNLVPVNAENLHTDIRQGIVSSIINLQINTSSGELFLNRIKPTDYIVIAYCADSFADPILLLPARGDYSIVETTNGSNLQLASKWLEDADAILYITGLRLGV